MKNRFICAEEVAQELSVSKPYAYKLIRQLNEELKAKGFITISGRVNRSISMKGSTEQEIHKGILLCPARQDRNKERRTNNAGI